MSGLHEVRLVYKFPIRFGMAKVLKIFGLAKLDQPFSGF